MEQNARYFSVKLKVPEKGTIKKRAPPGLTPSVVNGDLCDSAIRLKAIVLKLVAQY